ncbi:hypothetical protein [Niastella sp. OAS944]|uniref:hypothetical protein n=1 Tax=Niastella sp. OAS944 TaxID=2664089 RepID=UPI003469991B|nr:hypothetical protein [Chitinophagaceae bacterium OAS944]
MKKKSLIGLIILALCGILVYFGLKAIITLMIIAYNGEKVQLPVVEVPSNCDKYNYIKVLYKGNVAAVSIGKASCVEREYRVGQKVTLVKHPAYDAFVWPDSHPEVVLILFVGLLVFLYFSTRKYYHPPKKDARPKTRSTF